jgi:uncharacterized protein (DUF3084 family)
MNKKMISRNLVNNLPSKVNINPDLINLQNELNTANNKITELQEERDKYKVFYDLARAHL